MMTKLNSRLIATWMRSFSSDHCQQPKVGMRSLMTRVLWRSIVFGKFTIVVFIKVNKIWLILLLFDLGKIEVEFPLHLVSNLTRICNHIFSSNSLAFNVGKRDQISILICKVWIALSASLFICSARELFSDTILLLSLLAMAVPCSSLFSLYGMRMSFTIFSVTFSSLAKKLS